MSVEEERIRKLKVQSERLRGLLADPHPGLYTWVWNLESCRREIDAVMDGKRDDPGGDGPCMFCGTLLFRWQDFETTPLCSKCRGVLSPEEVEVVGDVFRMERQRESERGECYNGKPTIMFPPDHPYLEIVKKVRGE